jgi:CRISPR type III-B/RAMP module RAMP protein Cmr1
VKVDEMPKITLTLETVTPLLMNGGDFYIDYQNRKQPIPDIRAASFRGVLRYWLRAVLGREYGKDYASLRNAESHYFGNTEGGSAIRVRVEHSLSAKNPNKRNPQDQEYLTHKVLPQRIEFAGFEKKRQFNLILDTHPLRRAEDMFTPQLYASLLLAFHLGAFGKRARRGGGNLLIQSIVGDGVDIPGNFLSVVTALKEQPPQKAIGQLISYIQSSVVPATLPANVPDYPIFDQPCCVVLLKDQPFDSYATALANIWHLSAPYPHIDATIQMFNPRSRQQATTTVDRRWAWGFAGAYLRRNDPFRNNRDWKVNNRSNYTDLYNNTVRRSSTVHIRVHRFQNNYYPLATIFKAKPDYDDKHSGQPSSWNLLVGFIDLLKQNGYQALYGDWSGWR